MATITYDEERETEAYLPKSPSFNDWNKVLFAGFWIRFLAYLVDLVSISALCGILVRPFYRLFQIEATGGLFSSIWFAEILVFLAYFILMTKFFQQTLGKMFFGLKVVRPDQKKLTWMNVLFREGVMRFFLKTIWPLYAVTAFTPYKQGLADLIENTSVVYEKLLPIKTNHSQ